MGVRGRRRRKKKKVYPVGNRPLGETNVGESTILK
jgi:hypothetical protein